VTNRSRTAFKVPRNSPGFRDAPLSPPPPTRFPKPIPKSLGGHVVRVAGGQGRGTRLHRAGAGREDSTEEGRGTTETPPGGSRASRRGSAVGHARPRRAKATGAGSFLCTCACGRARRPRSPARTTRSPPWSASYAPPLQVGSVQPQRRHSCRFGMKPTPHGAQSRLQHLLGTPPDSRNPLPRKPLCILTTESHATYRASHHQ
jgi:hypothetical protein